MLQTLQTWCKPKFVLNTNVFLCRTRCKPKNPTRTRCKPKNFSSINGVNLVLTCFVQVPLQLHRRLHLHVVLEDAAAELSRLRLRRRGPSLRLRRPRRGPTRTAWGAVARCLLPALAAALRQRLQTRALSRAPAQLTWRKMIWLAFKLTSPAVQDQLECHTRYQH